MKAKTIDRLALTRQKFGAKMYGDEKLTEKVSSEHREGYSICPNCGLVYDWIEQNKDKEANHE